MPQRPNTYDLKVADGGQLATVPSLENAGDAAYIVKENWRRYEQDQEGLREGDLLFRPNADLPQGTQALDVASEITLIAEVVRPNGDRSVIAATKTHVYRYVYSSATWQTIGSGYSTAGRPWQVASLNGYLVFNNAVDLPFTFRHEDSAVVPIYALREAGVASVGFIYEFNSFLHCFDITEIIEDELADILNGGTPYGLVASNLTNRITYKNIWSEFGDPRRWAVQIPATITAAGMEATLDYAVSAETLSVGAKIAIIGAGLNGGTIGGQIGIEDGAPVTDIDGLDVTWSTTGSDPALTYPLRVVITQFRDLSSLSGGNAIQDDGSAILAAEKLGTQLIVYRETCIFTGRYTGVRETPFVYRRVDVPKEARDRMLRYPRTLCNPTGDYHLFAGGTEWYTFDGLGEPRPMQILNRSKNLFFSAVSESDPWRPFALRNQTTREMWFCTSTNVYAFDYQFGSVSTIDVAYTAGCFVNKPASAPAVIGPRWMLLAVLSAPSVRSLVQYGRVENQAITYLRRGAAYTARILSTLWPAPDRRDFLGEIDARGYLIQLASGSGDPDVTIKLYSTSDPAKAPTLRFTRTIENPKGKGFIPALYKNTWFQDEISVTTTDNMNLLFTQRSLEVAPVRSRANQRIRL
jgi:hypothetical protein